MFRIIISLMLLIFALGSCSRYSEVVGKEPKGSELNKELAQNYKILAADEAVEQDWAESQLFLDKAEKASQNVKTMPEELNVWNLPNERVAELKAARKALTALLEDTEITVKQPKIVAKAQTSFDCWVKEREDHFNKQDAIDCRQDFYNALRSLNPLLIEDPYIVYFGEDSYIVRAEGQHKIREISKRIRSVRGKYEVVVNGHADTKGEDSHNMKLSHLRALAVKKLIVRYGVPPEVIKTFAFGESALAISSPDETLEARNRRVEIYVNPVN